MRTLLCIDDDESMWDSIRAIFEGTHKVFISGDVPQAREILKTEKIDLILLDHSLPGTSGLTFLAELSRLHAEIPVLMVTALDSDYSLAEALRRGARGRITKPFDVAEIRHHVEQALASLEAPRMRAALEKEAEGAHPGLITAAPALQPAIARALDLRKLNAPIFLTGERGVGKEWLARHLHEAPRRAGDLFYRVRCRTAQTPAELEAELFGGDGSGQPGVLRALTGTLFFDEVNRLPAPLLERLGEVVAGQIASHAPHAPLLIFASSDLPAFLEGAPAVFAELAATRSVEMLPLRERADDIPVLAYHLLTDLAQRSGSGLTGFTPESLRLMKAYRWPGNLREMENVIERLVLVYGEYSQIEPGFLPREICPIPQRISQLPGMTLDQTMESFERGLLLEALDKTGWNATKAAQLLSTTPRKIGLRVDALKLKAEGRKAG